MFLRRDSGRSDWSLETSSLISSSVILLLLPLPDMTLVATAITFFYFPPPSFSLLLREEVAQDRGREKRKGSELRGRKG